MDKKPVSRKVPMILAIAWLVAAIGSFFPVWFTIRPVILSGAPTPALAYIYCIVGTLFSIVMMTVIRILSKKAQIQWLAILSKILLIFYSVCIILYLLALGFLAFKGWL